MASNITVDTLTKGSTTLNTDEIVDTSSNQICKAWVNFNGTGTVAIRDSYNVASVTDNGSGDYTVNFSTSVANANFCTHVSGTGYSNTDPTRHSVIAGSQSSGASGKTASSCSVRNGATDASVFQDAADMNVSIFSN